MSILYKNYNHWYFNQDLLLHIQNGENDKVRSILQHVADCHLISCTSGATLLHFAAKYGNAEISQHLIDLGANVDAENQIMETPLMYAVAANQLSTVLTLLDANADVLKREKTSGMSAAWQVIGDRESQKFSKTAESQKQSAEPACKKVCMDDQREIHENIMTAVLSKVTSSESFRNVDQAFYVECPLNYFIELKNTEITRALLENGYPVNAKKRSTQETALHEAVRRLDLENVKVLLEYNADANAYNGLRNTPLACIQSFDDPEKTLAVVKALINAGAMLKDGHYRMPGESILLNGNGEIIEFLLQCPIDLLINARIYERTPLYYLAMNRNPEILKKLRDLRADDFEQSKDKLLCLVAQECRMDAVKFLLKCGANVNFTDHRDYTTIRAVVKRSLQLNIPVGKDLSRKYLGCIQFLLESGADPQKFRISDNFNPRDYERHRDNITPLIEPIFAYLSLRGASGQAINQLSLYEIQSSLLFINIFETNKRHFQQMKTIDIDESVTLLDFWTANDQQIYLYARNKVFICNLTDVMKVLSINNSYSSRILYKRFMRFSRLVDWKGKTLATMNEILSELCNLYINNIAEKIVEYLVHEKWEEIVQAST